MSSVILELPYTQNQIQKSFDAGAFRRGKDLYLNGKVLSVDYSGTKNHVQGVVRGSNNEKYDVKVEIDPDDEDGEHFDADCTCPVAFNCKHAVALLMFNLDQIDLTSTNNFMDSTSDDRKIESWLSALERQSTSGHSDQSKHIATSLTNCLIYILSLQSNDFSQSEQLRVEYFNARVLNAGGYGKLLSYEPYRVLNREKNAYISESDEEILREAHIRKMIDSVDSRSLSGKGGTKLLLKMIETGRCFWLDKDNPPLSLGEPKKGRLAWQNFNDGGQQLKLLVDDEKLQVLPVYPPYYLDLDERQCGSVEVDLPETVFPLLQNAPVVPIEAVSEVADRLGKVVKNIPVPESLKIETRTNIKPVPHLRFTVMDDNSESDDFDDDHFDGDYFDDDDSFPVVEIKMDYGGEKSSLFSKSNTITFREKDLLIKIPRDIPAEERILEQIQQFDLLRMASIFIYEDNINDFFVVDTDDYMYEDNIWVNFILREIPKIKDLGWEVTFEEDFPYHVNQVDEWSMNIDDTANNHWFDLNLGVVVNGQKFNLIHMISSLIHQNPRLFIDIDDPDAPENVFITMKDGSLLALPIDRIKRIIGVLMELFDKKEGINTKISLPRWRAAELNELQSQGLQWQGGEALKASAERLTKFDGIKPCKTPKKFKATLRDYQKEGLAWLQFLREYEFHGILADDMGLGKTVQTLAHITEEKAKRRLKNPVLVIAPTSLMYNWRVETEQFAPHLKVLTLHGPDRKKYFDDINKHDIVLTTYPLLMRDESVLLAQEWHMVVLDEAQNIKNSKAKSTKVAYQLKAKHRLCLTGTPMENHLGELWSIFNFLMPGLLGNEQQFRRIFRTPIEKQANAERAQRLATRLAPFMLRRTKDEVAKELPEKTEIIRTVTLEGVQRDLYETVRVSMQKKVRDSIKKLGMNKSHIIVLDALLKLRQICCDPRLLKSNAAAKEANSGKFDLLMTLLPELLEEGRKILLFSQFTSMLSLIEEELKVRKIKYVKLTGQTRNREKPIAEFQDGDIPLFLISLKAGGTGLNLTAADTVIHYDPWWNPAVEAQATDRAHRIGQTKPVFVYKLLTEGTVEARIQDMQANKRKLAAGLFDSSGKSKLPNANDLQALFEPLEG